MTGLRIVRVLPFYTAAFGGPVVQAFALNRVLASRGHDVRVITSDLGTDGSNREHWVERDGYRVWHARTAPWNRVAPYWMPRFREPLQRELPQADVLTINVGLTLAGALARRCALRHDVPYVYNAEGALCPTRLAIKRLRKAVFLRAHERRVLRDAAALQALTEKDARDLAAQGAARERVHVVPNGVEIPERDAAGGTDFRGEHDIPGEAPVVLFLGRLHAIKGLDLLLRAATACRERPDLVIVVAGEGGERAPSERLAADLGIASRVRFVGSLDAADRLRAMAAADLFVLPSSTEGLPLAVLEACAAGLPVLITEHCNVPEVARAGAGRVVPRDVGSWHAALRDVLADRRELAAMGAAARALAAERFELDAVAGRLERLYTGIAEPRRA